jgi:hypothetical protein
MSSRDHIIANFGGILLPNGSYIDKYDCIHWYNVKGDRHREDGPAVIHKSGNSYWYLNNLGHPFNRWLKLTPTTEETKLLLRLQYA